MRIANLSGRLAVIRGQAGAELAFDVHKGSSGRFGTDPQAIYEEWDAFTSWAATASWEYGVPVDPAELGSPAPVPRQIFGIGLNYRSHADEAGFGVPDGEPPVFTKFASSITGPCGNITLPPGGHTDWEVELVVVIGRLARRVGLADAPDYVAGYAVGQDISERILQMASTPPQFSLGKSLPGFAPVGPWLVTPDEFDSPNGAQLTCSINGEQMQRGRTSEMIFSVPALIMKLSQALPLLPGDVIFTGTPAGVGLGMRPQRWLADGDELVSRIEGIGEMRHRFVAG